MATIVYKVVDQPWSPNDPSVVETMLNTTGQANWKLLVAYLDKQRERTRWVFNLSVAPVTYKVVDQAWSPSDPAPSETMLNTTGQTGWQLVMATPDTLRGKTRWIFSQ